ncbi:MAG: DUF3267 domain-containing protein [Anaerolineaceae bacterium]|nr:DUF3267 domain-containing protein [Anaerolineaceae bacterium]
MSRPAIHELPPDYREVEHLVLLEPSSILRLNVLALILLVAGMAGMLAWRVVAIRLRGPLPGNRGVDLPWWVWALLLLVAVIPVHEGLHGLAILWAGHRPRFGMMLSKGAFYATADNALFWRNAFVVIALAPLIGITLLGMVLTVLLPDDLGFYAALLVAINAGSAIGDVWMTWAVLRYSPAALVRDEADSIRIYTRVGS